MQLELSRAAFRVLQRAAQPTLGTGASPAALLYALATEDGCRGAEWLEAEGITADTITSDLGLPSPDTTNIDSTSSPKQTTNQPVKQSAHYSVDCERVMPGRISSAVENLLTLVWQRCTRISATMTTEVRHSQRGLLRVRGDRHRHGQNDKFVIATEHLLLALTFDEGFVGTWLRQRDAFAPEQLFARIERLYDDQALCDDAPAPDDSLVAIPFDEPEHFTASVSIHSTPDSSIARVIDAASNRAREALRVLEDYARFVLNASDVTQKLKSLRHDLAVALSQVPRAARLLARDTAGDVGTTLTAPLEYARVTVDDVLAANAARLSESLRTLEEFLKISYPAVSRKIEQLRYCVYTAEKELGVATSTPNTTRRDILNAASLYVIVDGGESLDSFSDLVTTLVNASVDIIQLRDKKLSDSNLLERAERLRLLTRDTHTLCIINDRLDIALACGADGVHVGQDEMPVQSVRRIAGDTFLIGLSTHSLAQAQAADCGIIDYIGIGPVFASPTKPNLTEYVETGELSAVATSVSLPVFAIGGITCENITEVLACGIRRVVVSSAIVSAGDPASKVTLFRDALACPTS